jgi:hypothetical protein
MKYIISESRLEEIFEKYVDSQYGLVYDKDKDYFRLRDGSSFASYSRYSDKNFYYHDWSDRDLLKSMFGENSNKLMLNYLRKRFPKLKINGIEGYDY